VSPRPLPNDQLNELLKLRAEVVRLRQDSKALGQLRAAAIDKGSATRASGREATTIDSEANKLTDRINALKQGFERMPEKKIPELQYLDNRSWLRNAAIISSLDTEADLRAGLSRMREDAKNTFCRKMGWALQSYVQASNGELPADVSQLKPYFDSPVDDSVFQRYQMTKTGNVSGLQPDEMVITEKAPVDDQYDILYQIGVNGGREQGIGARSGQSGAMTWGYRPQGNTVPK
jgi:hypothetical protein